MLEVLKDLFSAWAKLFLQVSILGMLEGVKSARQNNGNDIDKQVSILGMLRGVKRWLLSFLGLCQEQFQLGMLEVLKFAEKPKELSAS